jgi:aconitate hydratase A / 2-methylisocitrate dehydratase
MSKVDPFGARSSLEAGGAKVSYFALDTLQQQGVAQLDLMPMTIKVLLEDLLRLAGTRFASEDDVVFLSGWGAKPLEDREFAFSPARVILQDFTGVPAVVDLAAMRSAIARAGGNPREVDPLVPVDLVIDHSVQVDAFGGIGSYGFNVEREYERNAERYSLLRWAQQAFAGFRVVPPGMGIVHQVNLEYLAKVVQVVDGAEGPVAIPDSLVGTDSHTPMVNGLSVLGWGVGGIEAEAALLGQPLPMLTPKVVGFRFSGALEPGVTATDLVLTVTEILRTHGVVGKFVEFYGEGLSGLTVADRATLSNMSPEFGATASLWPVDDQTLAYLRLTGRDDNLIELVERYSKEQGMFRTDDTPDPQFTETLDLDLSSVVPSVAGPRRPQDRSPLDKVWESFTSVFPEELKNGNGGVEIAVADLVAEGGNAHGFDTTHDHVAPEPHSEVTDPVSLRHGSVVIAAITSCTNTSNPPVMLAAGLLAKKAAEKGLRAKPWVKTSLAPGSRVVTDYLKNAGLLEHLEKLGFYVVGYGCTTCIGNSGPLPEAVSTAVDENDLAVVSVLSGNRNFEGRIHPQVKASYLASPPLVVAFALAGTAEIDLGSDPLGRDSNGNDVYLKDIWPSSEEIEAAMLSVKSEYFGREYGKIFDGDEHWARLPSPTGDLYEWDPESSYVREPAFFEELGPEPPAVQDITGARVLVKVGDSVTTDHISPAGSIAPSSPAGKYLVDHGVEARDFNSYGARRGNHEVMVRGTFANIRLRNELVKSGRAGGWTTSLPEGDEMPIFDAALTYAERDVPLIIIAGKEYGSGSSRDWAAKGPLLLGVRAAIAESFERIHRSNLVAMGILPLQFIDGNAASLGLQGDETFDITGIESGLEPHAELSVVAHKPGGEEITFNVECRIDSDVELNYYRNGGVLQLVLRRMLKEEDHGPATGVG